MAGNSVDGVLCICADSGSPDSGRSVLSSNDSGNFNGSMFVVYYFERASSDQGTKWRIQLFHDNKRQQIIYVFYTALFSGISVNFLLDCYASIYDSGSKVPETEIYEGESAYHRYLYCFMLPGICTASAAPNL